MPKFDELAAFAAVVRARSFTRAAAQMGVSQSALSQTIQSLERGLNLKLLHRTTRSVSTTEAGERLFQMVSPRFADIESELAVLGEVRGKPAGTVRITASDTAVRTLVWPRLRTVIANYPDIKVEISSDNRFIDIVAERFDIGVRLGPDVDKDMIAVRMAADLRMVVVGSKEYFSRHSPPRTPKDLAQHDCICLRLPTHGGLLPWVFKRRGKDVNVPVTGQLVFNAADLMVNAALSGHGLAWVPWDLVKDSVADGLLTSVLDDWAMTFPGHHLYYASRRASPALTLIVEALRGP